MGLCPKCSTPVTHVNITEVGASSFTGKQWRGISYDCPSCRGILSVQIDPVALKTDTIEGTVARLAQLLRKD